MSKSGFPFREAEDLNKELQKYFDKLGRQMNAIAQLSALDTSASSATIAAKVNEIIAAAGER